MPFDFKKFDAKCAVMTPDELQREWEHYTRLISGAATSTTVSGIAVPFTLGISAIGVGLAAPAIHNARKKREIIEKHLQTHGTTHNTRKRDVFAPMAISGTVGLVTLGIGSAGADMITNQAVEHGFTTIAANEIAVKATTHLAVDGIATVAEEGHMKNKRKAEALNAIQRQDSTSSTLSPQSSRPEDPKHSSQSYGESVPIPPSYDTVLQLGENTTGIDEKYSVPEASIPPTPGSTYSLPQYSGPPAQFSTIHSPMSYFPPPSNTTPYTDGSMYCFPPPPSPTPGIYSTNSLPTPALTPDVKTVLSPSDPYPPTPQPFQNHQQAQPWFPPPPPPSSVQKMPPQSYASYPGTMLPADHIGRRMSGYFPIVTDSHAPQTPQNREIEQIYQSTMPLTQFESISTTPGPSMTYFPPPPPSPCPSLTAAAQPACASPLPSYDPKQFSGSHPGLGIPQQSYYIPSPTPYPEQGFRA